MIFFRKKKIGLVLGGGGVRGFFHMGVITALQESGVEVSEIAGTSVGAIVGLIYGANPKVEFRKITQELSFFELVKSITLGTKNYQEIEKFLRKYIKVAKFEDLKIKTKINVTDMNNQKEIVFEKGDIYPGVVGSMLIPGVFPPLRYKKSFLVDGGVSNNLPIVLIDKAKKILVSDISGPFKKIDSKTTAFEVLYTAYALTQRNLAEQQAKKMKNRKIINVRLDDNKTFILDFRKKNYEYLFNLGYKKMMEVKNQL